MTHYVAVIRLDAVGCYTVSFPDLPGVVTAGDTLDEAISEATEALAFAAEGWMEDTGEAFPPPRTFEELRDDAEFAALSEGADVVEIPLEPIGDDEV